MTHKLQRVFLRYLYATNNKKIIFQKLSLNVFLHIEGIEDYIMSDTIFP